MKHCILALLFGLMIVGCDNAGKAPSAEQQKDIQDKMKAQYDQMKNQKPPAAADDKKEDEKPAEGEKAPEKTEPEKTEQPK